MTVARDRQEPGERVYHIVGPGDPLPPDYGRVVAALSARELREELELGRGDPGYLAAVAGELERRPSQ